MRSLYSLIASFCSFLCVIDAQSLLESFRRADSANHSRFDSRFVNDINLFNRGILSSCIVVKRDGSRINLKSGIISTRSCLFIVKDISNFHQGIFHTLQSNRSSPIWLGSFYTTHHSLPIQPNREPNESFIIRNGNNIDQDIDAIVITVTVMLSTCLMPRLACQTLHCKISVFKMNSALSQAQTLLTSEIIIISMWIPTIPPFVKPSLQVDAVHRQFIR